MTAASPLNVACVQLCSTQDVGANLEIVLRLCREAKAQGAALVALPENAFCHPFDPQFQSELDRVLPALRRLAAAEGLWIVAGTLPTVSGCDARVYARVNVIADHGEVVAHYDKLHLFDVHVAEEGVDYRESDAFLAGDAPTVVDTPWGRIGLAVCYDLRFPELFVSQEAAQPFVWIVPSAFTFHTGTRHWQHLLAARALDTFSWIVAPAQGGVHPGGRRTYGHAAIIDPDGACVAACAGEGSGFVIAALDAAPVQARRVQIPLAQHRRFRVERG